MADRQRSGSGRGMLLISGPLLYAVVMLAAPMAAILVFSFWTQDFLNIDTTPTWANYRQAF